MVRVKFTSEDDIPVNHCPWVKPIRGSGEDTLVPGAQTVSAVISMPVSYSPGAEPPHVLQG